MMPEQAGALVIANNNFFLNRSGQTPRYIICHGTAGGNSAVNIATYFASTVGTANPVSSHYVIDQQGVVVQCVSEANGAWANGAYSSGHATFWNENVNPNLTTISIEHVKAHTDNSDTLTDAQFEASWKLINDICERWDIPKKLADASGGITGHFSIDPVNRSRCPGPYPWDTLIANINGGGDTMLELTDPTVARYFQAGANGSWACVNGVTMIGDNLKFYRGNNGLALLGLPLSNEIYPKNFPGTAIVPCERGIIAYDPGRTIDNPLIAGHCYLLHIDKGPGLDLITNNATATLNNQITSLKSQVSSLMTQLQGLQTLQAKLAQIKQFVATL